MDDKVIEITDYLLSNSKTYREARLANDELFKSVTREIELRALEQEI